MAGYIARYNFNKIAFKIKIRTVIKLTKADRKWTPVRHLDLCVFTLWYVMMFFF